LEDADEFEQLLAILEDIDHEDCKNSVYRVFANLAQDIDVISFNNSSLIFIGTSENLQLILQDYDKTTSWKS